MRIGATSRFLALQRCCLSGLPSGVTIGPRFWLFAQDPGFRCLLCLSWNFIDKTSRSTAWQSHRRVTLFGLLNETLMSSTEISGTLQPAVTASIGIGIFQTYANSGLLHHLPGRLFMPQNRQEVEGGACSTLPDCLKAQGAEQSELVSSPSLPNPANQLHVTRSI